MITEYLERKSQTQIYDELRICVFGLMDESGLQGIRFFNVREDQDPNILNGLRDTKTHYTLWYLRDTNAQLLEADIQKLEESISFLLKYHRPITSVMMPWLLKITNERTGLDIWQIHAYVISCFNIQVFGDYIVVHLSKRKNL